MGEFELSKICKQARGQTSITSSRQDFKDARHDVSAIVRIIATKTKRIKQHARRARARAATANGNATPVRPQWPKQLQAEAKYHQNWRVSLFMHVAAIVFTQHIKALKLQVQVDDSRLLPQDKCDISELIGNNASSIGLSKYALPK